MYRCYMKRRKQIFLGITAGLAVALMPFTGRSLTTTADATTNSPAPFQPPASSDADMERLPRPVRDVMKMINAGVANDVMQAYIQSSPSTFNLTPEQIIQLQKKG